MIRSATTAIVIAAIGVAATARAELNVPIAARVLPFLLPPPTGQVVAAIIVAPDRPASLAEAAAIERSIGNGLPVGGAVIRTKRVPVTALADLHGMRFAFVTAGLRGEHDAISAAATRESVVTITSDRTCVQTGRCVVAVESAPRVQITVNRAAARAVKARFGSAFLMLVKEI